MLDWLENLAVQQAMALLRHGLTGVGGALVGAGLMSQEQSTQIVGGIVALVGVIWSIIQKHKVAEAIAVVKATGLPATPAPKLDELKGLY